MRIKNRLAKEYFGRKGGAYYNMAILPVQR